MSARRRNRGGEVGDLDRPHQQRTAAENARQAPWDRRPRWAIGALAVLNLALCLVLFEPKLHTGGDSSHYVILAESVLRAGDGYADAYLAGEPVPHTKYPPLYPMLLAPLLALFGRNFVVLKLLSVALTVGSVFVFTVLVRERYGSPVWFWLGLAFAASPVVVDYSHWMLSEAPYLFFTLLALLFLHRERAEERIGRYFWLALLAIVATYYVRGIGVVFIAAGSLYLLATRQWRKTAIYSAVAAALSLPWFIRNQVLSGEATPYLEQFLLQSVYEPEAGYHDLGGMIGRFFTNVWIYSAREMPRVLAGSESAWAATGLLKGLALLLCALALVGFVHVVRRRLGAEEIYFALSCLAILLFEEVVSDVRYLMPLVPLILFYATDGALLAAGYVRSLRGVATPAVAILAVVAAVGLLAQLARVPANVEMIRQYARGDRYAGYHPAWRSFFGAADWIAATTPADAVVTVRKPRLLHLWADRKVLEYPFSTDADSVLSVILESDYVVVDQISGTTGRYLVPAIESAPARFRVVHQTEGVPTWVLQVLPPGAGPTGAP